MTGDHRDEGELNLGSLADDVSAVQRPIVDSPARLRQVRSRLLVSGRAAATARAPLFLAALFAGGAAVALAIVFVRADQRPPAPLSFRTGASGEVASVGAPLRAPGGSSLPVQFSDGSAFTAAPRAEIVVAEVTAHGARLVVERGALTAAVVHRPKSRWRVQAGPYSVLVTGTRFDVAWDPGPRSFSLTLREGGVTVFGPSLPNEGRRVSPNETMRLSPAPPTAVDRPSVALRAEAPNERKAAAADRRAAKTTIAARTKSWRELARAGRYADSLAAAEAEGFPALCRRSVAADLILLGNTARFAHRPDRAEEAFRAARVRAEGAHARAVAAFELGRLASDVHRRHLDAADWFAVYLREEPEGALADEATGRRLEALDRAGDREGARRAAARYRAQYPGGPYQNLARKVLGM